MNTKGWISSLSCIFALGCQPQTRVQRPGVSTPVVAVPVAYCESREENYQEAQRALGRAYEQGEAQHQTYAAYHTGHFCDAGWGMARDVGEAVKWYRLAAERGGAWAQFQMGLCYEYGQGVPRDQVAAGEWYVKAAQQGYPLAQSKVTGRPQLSR